MPFSDSLRRVRLQRGLTQEQVALACGWGQSRIANYEADPTSKHSRRPDPDEIPVIASALGVEIGELFDAPPKASQAARLEPAIVTASLKALRQSFAGRGALFDPERDADLFVFTYEFLAEQEGEASPENLIDFGRRLAERIAAKEREDGEPGKTGPVGETDQRPRKRGAAKT